MKKNLYFISSFPGDNAPTLRTRSVSKLFESVGFEVSFVIMHPYLENEVIGSWKGHTVYSEKDLCFQKKQRVSRNIEKLSSLRLNRFAQRLISQLKPEVVFIYGGSYRFAKELLRLREQYKFKLMADETDWFSPRKTINLFNYFKIRSENKRKLKLDIHFDGVISTSDFFDKYFKNHQIPSFFLPAVFQQTGDINLEDSNWANASTIQLVYAGSPHAHDRKDVLSPLLRAMTELPDSCKKRITLTVIGPSREDLIKLVGTKIIDDNHIRIAGRLSHQAVLEELKTKHFGVLFRHDQLYAKAGFSTKFGECMLNGVPMICNRVGGADAIITNRVDGLVLPDANIETIRSALCDVCKLTPDELLAMRKAAYLTANSYFVLDNYYEPFSDFLNSYLYLS